MILMRASSTKSKKIIVKKMFAVCVCTIYVLHKKSIKEEIPGRRLCVRTLLYQIPGKHASCRVAYFGRSV